MLEDFKDFFVNKTLKSCSNSPKILFTKLFYLHRRFSKWVVDDLSQGHFQIGLIMRDLVNVSLHSLFRLEMRVGGEKSTASTRVLWWKQRKA